ncbi:hypothetical protein SLA_2162 [Streptomyces laurentii]|uniref:Uncharacterized protein n=1 Tax=Streptomyces laurentii TaxID=39478 RepID=A0A160NYA3_STRLU|nr:hypothetical protein SLA_2162 [Streptomyces laurentii]
MKDADDPPPHPEEFATGHATCELGETHDGDHAEFLWFTEKSFAATWLRWSDADTHTIVTLPCCTALTTTGDGCGLYADHPSDHSWAVTDPTREALRADLMAHPERFGLPPDYFNPS